MKRILLLSFAVLLLCSLALAENSNQGPTLSAKDATQIQLSKTAVKADFPVETTKTAQGGPVEVLAAPSKSPKDSYYLGAAGPALQAPAGKKEYTPPPPDPRVILQGGDNIATATVIPSLPYSDAGTTVGYTNDYDEVCPYTGSTSPDVVYSYTPASDVVVDVSLCGNTAYDSKVYVYENAVGNLVGCNDDYCSTPSFTNPFVSHITPGIDFLAGNTYYIVVDGFGGASGTYTIDVTEALPCVTCPPEGILEGEPDCGPGYYDTYNGGCNSDPDVFQNIGPTDVICGISGNYVTNDTLYRDTDWYTLTLSEAAILGWHGVAEFPLLMFIIDSGTGNCLDYTILTYTTAAACDTINLSYTVPAGTYWLWVGPSVFSGYDCPQNYTAWVTTETAPEPPPNDLCEDLPYPPPLLTDGSTLTFTGDNTGATSLGDCSAFSSFPNVWEGFYTTEPLTITLDYCTTTPAFGNVWLNLAIDCPCSGFTVAAAFENVTCGDGNYTMVWTNLPAGYYYYPVLTSADYNAEGPYTIHVSAEAPPPPPPNDNCQDVTPVPLIAGTPLQFTGDNTGATVDCPSLGTPEAWEAITTSECMDITIDMCGTTPPFGDMYIVITAACPCGALIYANDWDNFSCDGNWTVRYTAIPAGTYYLPVLTEPGAMGPYVMNVNGVACPPPPPVDETITAPGTFLATTCGAVSDCFLRPSEDYIYEVIIPQDGIWTFSLCNTPIAWDSYLLLGSSSCSNDIAFNDDYCPGNLSQIMTPLTAGTYYLTVEGFAETSCGDFTLDITMLTPPPSCDGSYYSVPPDWVNSLASDRRDADGLDPIVADDFTLTEEVDIDRVLWKAVSDGVYDFQNTGDWQILANDGPGGAPGTVLFDVVDAACQRYATGNTIFSRPEYVYEFSGMGVTLPAGTYYMALRPVNMGVSGQTFWGTAPVAGLECWLKSVYFGYPDWTPSTVVFGAPYDVNFCFFTPFTGCAYIPGDINNNGQANGVDVSYGVNYFKGFGPPPPTDCGTPVGPCPEASPFYAAGDVNANCQFNGVDITYFVNYLKGIGPPLNFCSDCPPAPAIAPGQIIPAIQPSKAKIESSDR